MEWSSVISVFMKKSLLVSVLATSKYVGFHAVTKLRPVSVFFNLTVD